MTVTKRKRRQYTAAEQRKAIELAADIGPTEAGKRLGIPEGTAQRWVFNARRAKAQGTEWPRRPESELDVDEPSPPAGEGANGAAEKDAPTVRRVARSYTPSERAEALELVAKVGVTETHKRLGMSRYSLYEWQRKAKLAAQGEGDSPTSGPDPADAEAKRDQKILAMWKTHPGLGPTQIRNQLRRKGIKTSTHTVRLVMEDAGYTPPKTTPRNEHTRRYEATRPNHIWHLDFVQRWIHRVSTFTLIILDDHSRFVVGHGVDDAERADMVRKTFEEAVERHGKPEMVVHDKGSAFWSWNGISRFTRLLEEMGVEQIPSTKQTNGKLENFNGNLHKELFDVHRFQDVNEMKRRLSMHLRWFNHRRTHQALGGLLVPADRFFGRVDEVMARIEAGAAADAIDQLDLRDRTLDLFRVVSTGGRTEVWLMGQKLIG